MEKTLTFTDNGKEYRLTFTRETVIATENMGFSIDSVNEKPITSLTILWRGAFLAHHSELTLGEVDELFNKVEKKELLGALVELYRAPVESLFEEEHSKNSLKWVVT